MRPLKLLKKVGNIALAVATQSDYPLKDSATSPVAKVARKVKAATTAGTVAAAGATAVALTPETGALIDYLFSLVPGDYREYGRAIFVAAVVGIATFNRGYRVPEALNKKGK